MVLTRIGDCRKDLDFRPLRIWPKGLPAIAWESSLLCGFGRREDDRALNISACEQSFTETMLSTHESLSLAELARLLKVLPEGVQSQDLVEAYGLKCSPQLELTLKSLAATPVSFQNWCSEKSVSARDLSALRSAKLHVNEICEAIATSNATKSQGVQILELLIELSLMDHEITELTKDTDQAEKWLRSLKQKRFHRAQSKDLQRASQVKTLPWPKFTEARWVRKGDMAGIEVRFVARSKADLKDKVNGLEKVSLSLDKSEDFSWNV